MNFSWDVSESRKVSDMQIALKLEMDEWALQSDSFLLSHAEK